MKILIDFPLINVKKSAAQQSELIADQQEKAPITMETERGDI